jgi:hypothetical protein
MPIETARLLLRPPRLTDAPSLFGFLGDPTAMQYTTPRASLRDCRRYLATHERQRRRVGCAPWVVVEKQAGAAIGFGGLYEDPFDPGWGVEVGYFFSPARRGCPGHLARRRASRFCPGMTVVMAPSASASMRLRPRRGLPRKRHRRSGSSSCRGGCSWVHQK